MYIYIYIYMYLCIYIYTTVVHLSCRFSRPAEGRVEAKRRQRPGTPPAIRNRLLLELMRSLSGVGGGG
jgi:hypothetical protein